MYFADGRFAVAKSNYSDGGFVIVTPKKALKDQVIKFQDGDSESGFLGGGAVLQNSRTSKSSARIDLTDLPDNVDVKQDTIISYGEYKRGFVEDIEAEGITSAEGILVDTNGVPFEQVTGYVINKDDTDQKPTAFFTNQEGHFLLTELKPGKYKMVVNVKDVEDLELEIKGGDNNEVIELGKIVCKDSI